MEMKGLSIPEPAVSRKALVYMGAGLWAAAGIVLLGRAAPWLVAAGETGAAAGALGMLVGILKGRLLFVPLAIRNAERIHTLSPHKEKICLFAFQTVRSYVLIASMITLGILLRSSSLSRTILGTVYVAVGSALLLALPTYTRIGRVKTVTRG